MSTEPYILSIDDDPDFNSILHLSLKKLGLKHESCTTPEEFFEKFKNKTPSLCFIDINLDIAQGAGLYLIKALRKKFGFDVPCIILSRRSRPEDIAMALSIGADDFIPKPLDEIVLGQKVKLFLNQKDINALPYFLVSEIERPMSFSFDISLYSISEYGIMIKTPHMMSKGTPLYLSGQIIRDIFQIDTPLRLTIQETSVDEKTREFMGLLEFDFEDPNMLSHVRNYILKNSKNNLSETN